MVQIPRYTPGSGPALRLGRESIGEAGEAGRTIQRFAQDAQGVVASWTQQDENAVMLRAQNQYLEKEAEIRSEIEGRRGLGAKGATDDYRKRTSEIRQTVRSEIGYGRVQNAFDVWTQQQETSAWPQVARFERGQDLAQARADLNLRVTNVGLELAKNNDLGAALKSLDEAYALGVSAGAMLPEEAAQKKAIAVDQVRKESFKVAYQIDKDAAIKGIGTFGLNEQDVALANAKYKADKKAEERERRAMAAEQSALLMTNVKGLEIIAQETGDTAGLRTVANRLAALGSSEAATRVLKTAQTYDAAYSVIKDINTLPLAEASKLVGGLTISRTDPMQAEQDYTVRDVAHKAFADRLKKFNSDPAASVDQMAVGSTPYERAQSRTRLQASQGLLPQSGVRVLANQERDQLQAAWGQADTKGKAALVEKIGQDYRDLAGDVLTELKVPAGAMFSRHVSNPYDKELLLRAGAAKKVEVPPGMVASDFTSQADSSDVVATLEEARRMMPSDQGYATYVGEMRNTVENLGKILGDAKAGRKWIDQRFSTLDDSQAKVVFPASLDATNVRRTLEAQRKHLLDTVPDFNTKQAIRNGVWVNDGDGFSLLSPTSGRVFMGSMVSAAEVVDGVRRVPVAPGEVRRRVAPPPADMRGAR